MATSAGFPYEQPPRCHYQNKSGSYRAFTRRVTAAPPNRATTPEYLRVSITDARRNRLPIQLQYILAYKIKGCCQARRSRVLGGITTREVAKDCISPLPEEIVNAPKPR